MSPWCSIHPIRGGRGIQEAQVWEAADALLQEGLRPTIERVRQKIGSGSPNTVSPMLERWFATLGKRPEGCGVPAIGHSLSNDFADIIDSRPQQLPLAIVQAAEAMWNVARREADQAQIQKTEATRSALELQSTSLAQKRAELLQREATFEQVRFALDEALASSRQTVAVMEAQMHAQQQESARLLSLTEAEVRRLRKALDEAVAGKEALREKASMDLAVAQRDARDAEERHLTHERRLLSEIDRERVATRQARAELVKEQKAHAAHADEVRTVLDAVQKALLDEKTAHGETAAAWSLRDQAAQVELATLRERAAGAEQRASDLTAWLERLQTQSEREIALLRENHASAKAALQQREAQALGTEKAPRGRSKKDDR